MLGAGPVGLISWVHADPGSLGRVLSSRLKGSDCVFIKITLAVSREWIGGRQEMKWDDRFGGCCSNPDER